MPYRSLALLSAVLFCVVRAAHVQAGPPASEPTAAAPAADPAFARGAFELQTAEAFELSVQNTSAIRPNIDYELTVIRVGYMMDTPHGSNFLRGNNEFLLEAVGGPIFHGPGSVLGGLSVMYRRNFLSPGAKIVPYFHLGGGGIYSDAYHDHIQQALGAMFEFNLQAGVGAHFRLSPRWSVDSEFGYRHFSDAHITQRNLGTNGIGGVFGVSRAF